MLALKALEGAVAIAIFVSKVVRNKRSRYFGFGVDAKQPSWIEAIKATIERN